MPSSLGLTGDLDDNDLIEDVEEAFDVQFSKEKLKQCWTVGDLFKLIEAQLPATAVRAVQVMPSGEVPTTSVMR